MSPVWIVLALFPVLGLGERFSCRGRILGGYYADVKSGCRAFHVCVRVAGGGIRDFRFFCPPGTLFQQEAQTCTDWGDDDGLACSADLYDGQFDLYKIGAGFDTKKTNTVNNHQRDEEPEFSLQRAETSNRLPLNPAPTAQPSAPQQNYNHQQSQSDLRAAHSSDFFSGRRDRGRDEPVSPSSVAPPTTSETPATRAPYRRPPPRASPRPTTIAPPQSPSTSLQPYDPQPKRKLIRKRPVHISSTPSTTTFQDFSTSSPRQYFRNYETGKPNYNKFIGSSTITEAPRTYSEDFVDVVKVSPKVGRYEVPTDKLKYNEKKGLTEIYNYNAQSTPNYNNNFNAQSTPNYNNNFNRNDFNTNNLNNNNNFNNNINKNDNFDSNNVNVNTEKTENLAFKATVRNNFKVEALPVSDYNANDARKNVEVSPNGVRGSTNNFNDKVTRNIGSSTPAYRNFNSVSYDVDKKFNSPNHNFASQTTPDYGTTRITAPLNLNTVAYKTNVGFDARNDNYAESDEDDGQYKPPSGEDDGQYRPELYERDRELLSGAHSLNIAASGNRLPEDQKPRRPAPLPSSQTSAPRPFSSAPFSTQPPRPTENTFQPSPSYQSTPRPQKSVQTQQTLNYFSYTTTARPNIPTSSTFDYSNSVFTTTTTRRPVTQANTPNTTYYSPAPSSIAPQPFINKKKPQDRPQTINQQQQPAQPAFSKPVQNNKEDTSYDYAYYDTDSGFTEYEHIEEFGKTKSKV